MAAPRKLPAEAVVVIRRVVAERIEAQRKVNELCDKRLAGQFGISVRYLKRIVSGEKRKQG